MTPTGVFAIHTRQETFYTLDRGEHTGEIFRVGAGHTLTPSGQWKVGALRRPVGFGYGDIIEGRKSLGVCEWFKLPLEQHMHTMRGDFWTYRNGNPKFRLTDWDHGTLRQWGAPVRKISRIPLLSVLKDLEWRAQHGNGPNRPDHEAMPLRAWLILRQAENGC